LYIAANAATKTPKQRTRIIADISFSSKFVHEPAKAVPPSDIEHFERTKGSLANQPRARTHLQRPLSRDRASNQSRYHPLLAR